MQIPSRPSRYLRLFSLLVLTLSPCLWADTVYETPEQFVAETLHSSELKPKVLWLDKNLQTQIGQLMGHPYPQARLRYWQEGASSLWILEEIGKEYPITAGFVVKEGAISRAQVLVYRETRGMEIHLPGFLQQFMGNRLAGDKLAAPVDSIAGATLSVNAMVTMAKVALLLHHQIQPEIGKPSTTASEKPSP